MSGGFWDRPGHPRRSETAPTPLWERWFPPLDPPVDGGLPFDVAEAIAVEWWDCDPHEAAALAWETYAASMEPEPSIRSVTTGVQSVSYDSGGSKWAQAVARAAWHKSMAGSGGSIPLDLAPPG